MLYLLRGSELICWRNMTHMWRQIWRRASVLSVSILSTCLVLEGSMIHSVQLSSTYSTGCASNKYLLCCVGSRKNVNPAGSLHTCVHVSLPYTEIASDVTGLVFSINISVFNISTLQPTALALKNSIQTNLAKQSCQQQPCVYLHLK